MPLRRLLLNEVLIEEDVAMVAGRSGWTVAGVRPPSEYSYERIWLAEDQRTFVTYVEDFSLGVRYLAVQGEDAEQVLNLLRTQLPAYGREDIRRLIQAAVDRDSKILALYHAAAFASEVYDPELFDFFRRMLADPDPAVRRAAIFGTSYAGWREFEAELRERRSGDGDEQVRHLASVTLSTLEQQSWSKPA